MKNYDETRRRLRERGWRRVDRTDPDGTHQELWRSRSMLVDCHGIDYFDACEFEQIELPTPEDAGWPITRQDPRKPYPRKKDVQAKTLADAYVLNVVRGCAAEKARTSKYWGEVAAEGGEVWVCTWDVQVNLPEVPEKVVVAKLHSMVRRNLIDACLCGCRGDITIEDEGYKLIASTPRIQYKLRFPEKDPP